MAKTNKFYITTAIDYVNARPHIGHAFEKTLADALARWNRLTGKKVWFLTGTDENAQKNAQAAKEAGIPVREFVDKNSAIFIELCKKLNLSNDDFIRTTEKRHVETAQKIFKKIYDKKEIYKGKYEGYYCTGCEAFITEKDLVNGKCPEHNREPELISEDAYFFKLSKYKDKLIKFVKTYIVPEAKKNEILARLENEELKDLCVSRANLGWGIDNPVDKKFKIYVWIDALVNYYSGANGNWPADVHVIGKGINWFHSVIWPALLLSAGIELPKKLLVHGYLNLGGKKISKSLGNVIDPIDLVEKYGEDSVRYSLLRCSVFDDSDYSEEILIERNNNELANKLGNLISRVSALAEKYGLKKCENKLVKKLKLKEIEKNMENFEIDKALNLIFDFIDRCNEYVQEKKPWESGDSKVLYELVDSIKSIAILLYSFIPSSSEKIAETFGFKLEFKEIKKEIKISKIKKAEILFKKIELEDKLNKLTSLREEKQNKSYKYEEIEGVMSMEEVDFSNWEKLELRVGKIEKVEDIENADKLYKLTIDIGSEKRVVCAGIKQHYKKEELKGKKIILFVNLKPRIMRGIESKGMILAAVNEEESKVILISPEKDIEIGARVR
ncbi:methionine--tRNA ligase [Candidatus Pacearchaeota archaeon]|nr:methionine--tRNA ligase [Candidatus Pacearchaeota archaeon]